MGRWKPNARERLERAAVELFVEQGFAATTVPQIAARAGLTTRTFFRHFADKREVLFAGDDDLLVLVAQIGAEAPATLTPMQFIAYGLETIAATKFEGQRAFLRTRHAVIQTDEGLRERELRKFSALSNTISQAFRDRGFDELSALLAAQLSVSVFGITIHRWLEQDSERPLVELVRDTLRALHTITADFAE